MVHLGILVTRELLGLQKILADDDIFYSLHFKQNCFAQRGFCDFF